MFKRSIIIFAAVFLTACASTPPKLPAAPTESTPKGSRVGLLVTALDSNAVHEHVGTLVFNNFKATQKLPWDLGQRAKTTFTNALTNAGYAVVELSPSDISPAAAANLIMSANQSWQVNPAHAASFAKIQEDFNLSALVVVEGQPTMADLECTGGPCVVRMIQQPGLFTRSIFPLTSYVAVAAFNTKVFQLSTPADLTPYEPLASLTRSRAKRLKYETEPKDFKQFTPEEFAPVAAWIDNYLQQVSKSSAKVLLEGVK